MTIWETLLIYAGAPLLIMAVVGAIIMAARVPKNTPHKLGEPWDEEPIWWGAVDEAPWRAHSDSHAIAAGTSGGAASGNW